MRNASHTHRSTRAIATPGTPCRRSAPRLVEPLSLPAADVVRCLAALSAGTTARRSRHQSRKGPITISDPFAARGNGSFERVGSINGHAQVSRSLLLSDIHVVGQGVSELSLLVLEAPPEAVRCGACFRAWELGGVPLPEIISWSCEISHSIGQCFTCCHRIEARFVMFLRSCSTCREIPLRPRL